jgi:UDP-N-acetylmuramyl tripeptide synthase
MQLERLIAALAPTDVVGGGAPEIRELAYDAREVPRDSLFFCVPGAKADGHDFAAAAVEQGAVALVVERPLDLEVPQLVVPSVRSAMPLAASSFSETRRPSCRSRRSRARTGRRRLRISWRRFSPRPENSRAC